MKRLIIALSSAAAALVFTWSASAAPAIDPLLQPLMKGTSSSEMVTVVATFQPPRQLPYLENSRRSYRNMRLAMTEDARNSQTRVYQSLMSGAESAGIPMKVRPLWVTNSMVIELPAHSVRYLQNFPEIQALIANRNLATLRPLERAQVSAAVQNEQTYTHGLRSLQIPELRAKYPQLTGRGVNVGVIDSGIDAHHPDLAGKVVAFRDFWVVPRQAPYDDGGHGTHVAGTIAGGNASGVQIGVAPEAKLTVAKIFGPTGGATISAILQAMDWMADPDGDPNTNDAPALVSNSWGGGFTYGDIDPINDVLCRAVDNWVKLGILPVFAAGNAGPSATTVGLPGACPSSFTVGATDINHSVAVFSSRGPALWKSGSVIKPDISAPGVDVRSAVPGGTYRVWSGTSMATPHVAGLAALIYQAYPGASIDAVTSAILSGVETHGVAGKNNDYGWGKINALKTFDNIR